MTGKSARSPVSVLDEVEDAEVAFKASLRVWVIWPCTSCSDWVEVVMVANVVWEWAVPVPVPVPAGIVELAKTLNFGPEDVADALEDD